MNELLDKLPDETPLANKYGGLSLLDELALLRIIARDCRDNNEVGAYLRLCGLISSIVHTQHAYNSLEVYTKEICLYAVVTLIRTTDRPKEEREKLVSLFTKKVSSRWQAIDFDIDADVSLMDASVPPLIDEYVPELQVTSSSSQLIHNEEENLLVPTDQPYTFAAYDIPESICKTTVGAASLSLLEEVSGVRELVATSVVPVMKSLWLHRGSKNYKQMLREVIVERPIITRIFQTLIELVKTQLTNIRFAADTIEGIDFTNVAVVVLKEIGCEDVADLVVAEFASGEIEGTKLIPSNA